MLNQEGQRQTEEPVTLVLNNLNISGAYSGQGLLLVHAASIQGLGQRRSLYPGIAGLSANNGAHGKGQFEGCHRPFRSHSSIRASHLARPDMRQPVDFPHRGAANGGNLGTIHTLPFLYLSFWGAGAGRRESPEMPGPQLEGTLWPSSCGWCVWVSLGALQPCPTLL